MAEIIKTSLGGLLDPGTLKRVADAARACKLVVFPTDTVYGIGSTGLIKAAARRIYQAKSRSALKPLPILVHSAEAAKKWVEWTPAAQRLASLFWPGALTLVLRPTAEGRLLTFAEYQTVAIRVPKHPLLQSLLEASGVPWASTSANLSGSPALNDAAAVASQFSALVDYIIDGGITPGLESTVVDASALPIRILRQGAVKSNDILEALEKNLL
jgi:L-threonylcarbamoyladenylate synthase